MNTAESYRRFRDTHGEVVRTFALGAQDEQSSCYVDLQQLSAKANNEFGEVYEKYLQELQAAASGDDSLQRATVANRNFQREYARLSDEFTREYEARYQRMCDALKTLTSDSTAKALDNWIQYLNEVRQNLGPRDEPKPKK